MIARGKGRGRRGDGEGDVGPRGRQADVTEWAEAPRGRPTRELKRRPVFVR